MGEIQEGKRKLSLSPLKTHTTKSLQRYSTEASLKGAWDIQKGKLITSLRACPKGQKSLGCSLGKNGTGRCHFPSLPHPLAQTHSYLQVLLPNLPALPPCPLSAVLYFCQSILHTLPQFWHCRASCTEEGQHEGQLAPLTLPPNCASKICPLQYIFVQSPYRVMLQA